MEKRWKSKNKAEKKHPNLNNPREPVAYEKKTKNCLFSLAKINSKLKLTFIYTRNHISMLISNYFFSFTLYHNIGYNFRFNYKKLQFS